MAQNPSTHKDCLEVVPAPVRTARNPVNGEGTRPASQFFDVSRCLQGWINPGACGETGDKITFENGESLDSQDADVDVESEQVAGVIRKSRAKTVSDPTSMSQQVGTLIRMLFHYVNTHVRREYAGYY